MVKPSADSIPKGMTGAILKAMLEVALREPNGMGGIAYAPLPSLSSTARRCPSPHSTKPRS